MGSRETKLTVDTNSTWDDFTGGETKGFVAQMDPACYLPLYSYFYQISFGQDIVTLRRLSLS